MGLFSNVDFPFEKRTEVKRGPKKKINKTNRKANRARAQHSRNGKPEKINETIGKRNIELGRDIYGDRRNKSST